jgi:FkbM family methyltransferase
MKIFGDKSMAYLQALRFVYLLRKYGNPEPEVRLIRRFLKKGDVAVDVGANEADWAYSLHQCVGKEGHVYAFEADPYYALATDITIKIMRLRGVRLFSFGLSDTDEKVILRVSNSKGLRVSGQGYIDKNADRNEEGVEVVQLKRLDSLIQEYPQLLNTALIKCDVEGYELFVFKGANEILAKARPFIILEVGHYERQGYSARDVYNFFEERGYSPFAMVGGDRLSATGAMLEHDRALSVNRVLIPKEKTNVVEDLI